MAFGTFGGLKQHIRQSPQCYDEARRRRNLIAERRRTDQEHRRPALSVPQETIQEDAPNRSFREEVDSFPTDLGVDMEMSQPQDSVEPTFDDREDEDDEAEQEEDTEQAADYFGAYSEEVCTPASSAEENESDSESELENSNTGRGTTTSTSPATDNNPNEQPPPDRPQRNPGDIDESLLEQLNAFIDEGHSDLPINKNLRCQIELLLLLRDAKAPLYLYDEVMKWTQRSVGEYEVNFGQTPDSRKTVLKSLTKRFDLSGSEPTVLPVLLPECKQRLGLVVHDFRQAVYSLLSDPMLMRDECLLFQDDDAAPFALPKRGKFEDINSGTRFRMAHKAVCLDPLKDVLCPIIFFIDKTHTDVHGNLCLEPVTFTLGIFTRAVRNLPMAWRSLGYLTNQALIKTNTASVGKARDYHDMLDHILASLRIVQESGGLAWTLNYRGKVYNIVLHMPVLFISGDTEGHDKLCGKFLSRGTLVKRLCRCCDTPTLSTDDPYFAFNYVKQNTVQKLIASRDSSALADMSQHLLPNAWHKIKFAGDCKRGIHGATPAEILHMIQLGLHKYLIAGFFVQKKEKKKSKGSSKPSNDNANDVYVAPNPDEVTGRFVMSDAMKIEIDVIAKTYGRMLQHQSDRNLPRTYFANGISSETKKSAHEQQGVLLLLLIILCSKEGDLFDKKMGKPRCGSFIALIEQMLLFEEWIKGHSYSSSELREVREYIPRLLELYKRVINRQAGVGMNFVKFHLPLHLVDDIVRFGAPANYSSGPGESNHKTNTKAPAQLTQRRADGFEFQTASRNTEAMLLDRAKHELQMKGMLGIVGWHNDVAVANVVAGTAAAGGSRYFLDANKWERKVASSSKRSATNWAVAADQKRVEAFLRQHCLPHIIGNVLPLFTEYKTNGFIFRAHPAYKADCAWQDWAYIEWGEEDGGIIPGRLLIFVSLLADGFEPFNINGSAINTPGNYVVIESLEQGLDTVPMDEKVGNTFQAHGESALVYWSKKELVPIENRKKKRRMKKNVATDDPGDDRNYYTPKLYMVSVDSITAPCIAVPASLVENIQPFSFLFLKPRDTWSSMFVDNARLANQKPESSEEED
jgi:hypothetical protein